MNKSLLLLLSAVLLLTFSCKTKKLVTGEVEKAKPVKALNTANATLVKAIGINENNFDYYNSRGTVAYKSADQSFEADADIIMEKDRYIYMNVTYLLGLPVARVWITTDSICILDILHKKCIITGYDYIRKMTNVSLNLQQLQRAFTGNSLYTQDENKMNVDSVLNYVLVSMPVNAQQLQTTYYDKASLKATRNIIAEKEKSREFRIEYTESYNSGSNSYPKDFNINIRAEKNVECRFALSYFAVEKKKETKFVVPKNFETVRM